MTFSLHYDDLKVKSNEKSKNKYEQKLIIRYFE